MPLFKSKESKYMWKQSFLVMFSIFIDGISGSQMTPYLPFLVGSFSFIKTKDQIGYYAGWILSAYFFAKMFSAYIYADLSDRIGRKPIIVFGNFFRGVTTLLFGFALNYTWSIVWMGLIGLLGGSIGVPKAMMSEICDDDNLSRCMSFIGAGWHSGAIFGAMIGGYTSEPNVKKGSLFDKYPYLLPNLIAFVTSFIGFILVVTKLNETLENRKPICGKKKKKEKKATSSDSDEKELINIDNTDIDNGLSEQFEDSNNENKEKQNITTKTTMQKSEPEINKKKDSSFFKHLKEHKYIFSIVLLYGFLGIIYKWYDMIVSISVILEPSQGGLNFVAKDIGNGNLSSSISFLVVQILLYPYLAQRITPMNIYRICSALSSILFILFPFINLTYNVGKGLYYTLFLLSFSVRSILCSFCLTSTFILVNKAGPTEMNSRINGLAQVTVAILRALGPSIGGSLFSWSVTTKRKFPFGHHFSYLILSLLPLCAILITYTIPKRFNIIWGKNNSKVKKLNKITEIINDSKNMNTKNNTESDNQNSKKNL
ncbi:protein zinc induced facilitator-like 1 [Anaeramoeba flamelloides]|uniref:Protein zinc induced facilitator-like 1 n=1 Tax=Anaeramoeba flamelloides TaxID=1746091 RepID=A0ABQ8ZBE8_9EUKA|nr:protein zinc induced facilitator-like 1 [Anaeramoeba flamelloides]